MGLDPSVEYLFVDDPLVTEHWMGFTGLDPGTTYFYRASSMTADGLVESEVLSFTTLRTAGPVGFAVVGDSGSADAAEGQVVNVIGAARPDLLMHLGDIVASGSYDANFDWYFFDYYTPLLQRIPCFLAIGNHDFGSAGDSWNWENAFELPRNSAEGTPLYYSFDHGDVHFVVLNVQWTVNPVFDAASVQYRWLTNDLAASTKPWKLLFTHAALLTCGNYASYVGPLLDLVLPVAERSGVQAIFSSHDHNYQRFAPTNGVHCVVSGGGGRPLYSFVTAHPALARFDSTYHCLYVGITNDTLSIAALDTSGRVFDSVTVQEGLPRRQFFSSSWHSPVIETAAANDGDGNISGQTFDFVGTPILPRAGRFSNLGRVHVNNDATHLYVGFEQVMIYPGNNLFLFIESPYQAGVSSMAGVGNGVLDAPGQAEGLDCLENLAFLNFAPSIGCVLGDEYADGQDRSFLRPGLGLPIGQGVFRLNTALSDVPDVRLQQFGRSPQVLAPNSGYATEQNADFIELSIPLRELADPQPGDIIGLGAVAGGWSFDSLAQTRQLDTSVLGYSLSSAGLGPAVLEAVRVELAADPFPRPRVAIAAAGTNRFRLTWSSVPSRRYDLECATNLTSFVRLQNPLLPLIAQGTTSSFVVTSADNRTFYRVVLLP